MTHPGDVTRSTSDMAPVVIDQDGLNPDVETDAPKFWYAPLPHDVQGAVTYLQAQIDQWQASRYPDIAADVEALIAAEPEVPEALAVQRAKLTELGLDPDVFAPLTPVVKSFRRILTLQTYATQPTREWVASQFNSMETDQIMAQLTFVPPEVTALLATVTPGETEINGHPVVIEL